MTKAAMMKKRAIEDGSYTPNRNAFGERAETHFVVIKKETALSQIFEIFDDVNNRKGIIEYTLDYDGFTPEEAEQFLPIASALYDKYRGNKRPVMREVI